MSIIPPERMGYQIPDVATKSQKAVMEEYQVTDWHVPYLLVATAIWGDVTYKRWLELESVRWMEKNCRDSWVRENAEGLVALFSWRKYMAAVVGDDPKE